jgi:serine protease Do
MTRRIAAGAVLAVVALIVFAACGPAAAGNKVIASEGNISIIQSGDDVIEIICESEGTGHGWLGVSIAEHTKSRSDKDDRIHGVLITDVYDDSPAEKAGLKDGDVIIEFEGKHHKDVGHLVDAVRSHEPGDEVLIKVLRDGEEKTLTVVLGEREHDYVWFSGDDFTLNLKGLEGLEALKHLEELEGLEDIYISGDWSGRRGKLGVYVEDLSEGLAEYFNVPDAKGVLIKDIVDDSVAEEAGIKAGDVIVKIGEMDVGNSDELVKSIQKMEPDVKTPVVVIRKGKRVTLEAAIGESEYERGVKVYVQALEEAERVTAEALANREYFLQKLSEDEMEELQEELEELREEIQELKEELKELRE